MSGEIPSGSGVRRTQVNAAKNKGAARTWSTDEMYRCHRYPGHQPLGDAFLHSGIGAMCDPCSGAVIQTDDKGHIVKVTWVRFEVHDTAKGTLAGFFNTFNPNDFGPDQDQHPDATAAAKIGIKIDSPLSPTHYWITSPYQVSWESSLAAPIEAPGPAGNLQPCVWGIKVPGVCKEGLN